MLLLLLVATELGTAACICGVLMADAVAAATDADAARKRGGTVLQTGPPAAACTGEAGGAAYDESKRMVPQGPNPLHN